MSELLSSVDCDPQNVEIVICEDNSPQREQIRKSIEVFSGQSPYTVNYYENSVNLGYDGNLRRLIELANGQFVMFMGDDDLFVPGALHRFLDFLFEHRDKKYILRSYVVVHPDGAVENFKYLKKTTVLPPGEETVAWLFKRSVSIAGFTISKDEAKAVATDRLDGTLLYQVYLMAEVCLKNESIFCDIPTAQVVQSFRNGKPMFGSSDREKKRYTPGIISQENSINFAKSYFEITDYLDTKNETNLTKCVKKQLSKYSYPFLSIQRKHGISLFLSYAKRLETELGFGCTSYFYIYKWALTLLGEKNCDRLILYVKNTFGYTPNL